MQASSWIRSLALALGVSLLAAGAALGHPPAADLAEAAQNFLAALTPGQRAQATFELQDPERLNFHFIPRPRQGLPIKEMSPAQRQLAHALLSSGLSQRGYVQAVTIMSLEQVLHDLEGAARTFARDPELYFVSIFGTPGPTNRWAWRVEGHHLSVNFTLANGRGISAAPTFYGANPAEVKQGPRKGLRALPDEEDLARRLVKSLDPTQRQEAILNQVAFKDIVTGSARQVKPLSPAGLAAARMTPGQQAGLRQLVEAYARRLRPEIADADLGKIQTAGWDPVAFAWAGGLERGEGHYYRVQGPTFLLEYDNTQNDNNHIHSVWRDFANDFGEDLLRRHYETAPH